MTVRTVSVIPEGKLVYGIQLPVQALSINTSMPWEQDATVDDLRRAALGGGPGRVLLRGDLRPHCDPRDRAEVMSTTWFNPVATLGWIAGQTKRARLMTNVYVAAYRHPLDTAKAFATLDRLSGGRVILGVGAGHVEGEFEALGIPFADRGRLTDEAVDGILDSWTSEYVGDVGLAPRPVQQPRPPIWIGGSSKPALRRVAERGDGWIPQGTPKKLMPESIEYLHEHRDKVRPGETIEVGMITEHIHIGDASWELPPYTRTGSPEHIAEKLNEYGALGISHLQLRFATSSIDELCDQIARFGDEVGPLLSR